MHLGVVAPDPSSLVGDDGVVLPAVPELARHIEELGGTGVPLGVRGLGVEPEVPGGLGTGGGDDVPARPAPADDVERGELPGQVVGRVVGGGGGGDQPDVGRRRGEGGEQGERLQRTGRPLGDVAPQLRTVGEKERVERSPLGDPSEPNVMLQLDMRVRITLRQPPRGFVVTGAHEEGVEVELAGCHECPFASDMCGGGLSNAGRA